MWRTVRIICNNCTFWSFRYLLQCLLIHTCLVFRTEKRKVTISLPLRRNADDFAVCLLHSRPKCITLCIFTNHHRYLYWADISYYINTFKMWHEYYLEEEWNLPQKQKSPIAAATAIEAWNDSPLLPDLHRKRCNLCAQDSSTKQWWIQFGNRKAQSKDVLK